MARAETDGEYLKSKTRLFDQTRPTDDERIAQMTLEMQETLEREMDDAIAITDPSRRDEAVQTVQSHMLRALIDCQRKTAERVKLIVAEHDADKNKKLGAKWAFGVVVGIVSVVGPIAAIKICKVIGILW